MKKTRQDVVDRMIKLLKSEYVTKAEKLELKLKYNKLLND